MLHAQRRIATVLRIGSARAAEDGRPPGRARTSSSRIRKRVTFILGSLAGTVLLGVQTYILHQQTALIATQTAALSLDQSVHIRERIVASSSVQNTVSRLIRALEAAGTARFNLRKPLPKEIVATQFLVDACLTSQCSGASIQDTLRALANENPQVPPEVGEGALRLAAFLERLDEAIGSALENPTQIDPEKKRDKLAPVLAIVTSGVTQCFFDPDKARNLTQQLATLRLISSNSFGISFRAGDHATFVDMTTKFPQTGTNTSMAIIEIESSVSTLLAREASPATTTFGDFLKILASKYTVVLTDLRSLSDQCGSAIKEDTASLKRMVQPISN